MIRVVPVIQQNFICLFPLKSHWQCSEFSPDWLGITSKDWCGSTDKTWTGHMLQYAYICNFTIICKRCLGSGNSTRVRVTYFSYAKPGSSLVDPTWPRASLSDALEDLTHCRVCPRWYVRTTYHSGAFTTGPKQDFHLQALHWNRMTSRLPEHYLVYHQTLQ